jgi:hypothetical protein
MTTIEALERKVAGLPRDRRRETEEALAEVTDALIEAPAEMRQAARDISSQPSPPATTAATEAANTRRLFALLRRVTAECLAPEDLPVARSTLQHLRAGDKLVALRLPMRRGYVYPAWQFHPETGEPLPVVPKLIEAAKQAHLTPLGLHLLMTSSAADQGRSPADWLVEDADYAIRAVAAAYSQGS